MTPDERHRGQGLAEEQGGAPRVRIRRLRGIGARMDPRISARRTAVIREQGRRRLIIAGVALGVVALLVGGWFLLHTPLFSARSVTVTGNVHETAAQVVAQAGLASHPPLLDVERRRGGGPPASSCRGCARRRCTCRGPTASTSP